MEEGRNLQVGVTRNTFGFENDQSVELACVGIELKELTFVNKAAATFTDRAAVRIGLLQERLVEGVGYLSLGYQLFGRRDAFAGGVDVDHVAVGGASAQTNFRSRFGHQIGLYDLALCAGREFARKLDNVLAFFLDGLRQTQYGRNLMNHAVHLLLEVFTVIYYAQVRVTRPGLDHLAVQFAGNGQSGLVGLLVALGVVGCGVELFGTVGSTYQMQDGVVARTGAQFFGRSPAGLGQFVPHLS